VIVADAAFRNALCAALRIDWSTFRNSSQRVVRYRNKFVAHLDDERVMDIPRMRFIRGSAAYLYDHLLGEPTTSGYWLDAHASAVELSSFTPACIDKLVLSIKVRSNENTGRLPGSGGEVSFPTPSASALHLNAAWKGARRASVRFRRCCMRRS
jgi:hypothetical protein